MSDRAVRIIDARASAGSTSCSSVRGRRLWSPAPRPRRSPGSVRSIDLWSGLSRIAP